MNVHLISVGDSMKMEAVRTLLEEAVYNVCDNAIKYNRNDGSVSIFLTQTAHEIQIVVKDTGVEFQRKIRIEFLRDFTEWIKVIPKRLEVPDWDFLL